MKRFRYNKIQSNFDFIKWQSYLPTQYIQHFQVYSIDDILLMIQKDVEHEKSI